MGLFDKAFDDSDEKSTKIDKETAFLGILMLADYSDGNVSADEVRAFGQTISRMKLYRDLPDGKVNRMIDRVAGMLKRNGLDPTLKTLAGALPENLHRAVFANAVNQVLSDGELEGEEKDFINNLRKLLNLPGDDAQMIAKVMVWKNQG